MKKLVFNYITGINRQLSQLLVVKDICQGGGGIRVETGEDTRCQFSKWPLKIPELYLKDTIFTPKKYHKWVLICSENDPNTLYTGFYSFIEHIYL